MEIKGKIGCEIECLVPKEKEPILIGFCRTKKWEVGSDGSIQRNSHKDVTVEFKAGVYPIENKKILLENLKEAFKLIKVNDSCGLHIHLSFENFGEYYKLLNWKFVSDFQKTINKEFRKLNEIRRLTNSFCKFYPTEEIFNEEVETQLKTFHKTGGCRYRCVNFNSCNLYKTIEFRIFPATKSIKTFEKYLNMLLGMVEKHLKGAKLEPISLEVKYKVKRNTDEPIVIREIITKEEKEQTRKERETITLEPTREETN